MTKDEKLGAAMEFAQRVIEEAWSDTVTEIDARDVLAWARELGLIYVKKVGRAEANDFGVPPGSALFMYEKWMDPTTLSP